VHRIDEDRQHVCQRADDQFTATLVPSATVSPLTLTPRSFASFWGRRESSLESEAQVPGQRWRLIFVHAIAMRSDS
jgi:hypothetical protein